MTLPATRGRNSGTFPYFAYRYHARSPPPPLHPPHPKKLTELVVCVVIATFFQLQSSSSNNSASQLATKAFVVSFFVMLLKAPQKKNIWCRSRSNILLLCHIVRRVTHNKAISSDQLTESPITYIILPGSFH